MSPSSISGLNQDCEHIVLLRQFCRTTFFQMSRGGSCFYSELVIWRRSSVECWRHICNIHTQKHNAHQLTEVQYPLIYQPHQTELKDNKLNWKSTNMPGNCIAKEYGTYAPKEKGKKHTFFGSGMCSSHFRFYQVSNVHFLLFDD